MGVRFNLIGALVLATASTSVFAARAIAEPPNSSSTMVPGESPASALFRAGYHNSGDFYFNRSILRQSEFIIGPPRGLLERGSFPEIEIERDAQLIELVYYDALYQQSQTDPYLRTPDLPNPFNTSLLQSVGSSGNRLLGSELMFEKPPMR